jgi:dual oxidase maturation factor 1
MLLFAVKTMERELYNALRKGLPYPILKVVEYLSVDRAGFVWGRQYRLAGYYACFLLWYACLSLNLVKVIVKLVTYFGQQEAF